MKKYLMSFTTIMLMAVCVGFISCGDDDDELEKTENLSSQDPAGTVVVNIQNDYWNGIYIHTGKTSFGFSMNSRNNFCVHSGEIISVGLVNGLGNVNKIPETGWSSEVAAVPRTGYVVRIPVATNTYCYSRIYMVDYMTNTGGGIMGATIKYQGDWKKNN